MCIAIPAKIIAIDGMKARVESGLLSTEVLLALSDAKVDQWVLVQSGIALAAIDENEADERLEILQMLQDKKRELNLPDHR
jgi:hydrogenase assembly chaperone HypC/HupF